MAVCYSVNLSDAVKENRWAAEFHRPGYKFVAKNPDDWRKIGRCLKLCQYGLSIMMNEAGRGVPIYRLNEIEDCFLSENPSKYAPISPRVAVDYQLEKQDILFCRTNGNINYVGRTGLFLGGNNAVFASYLVRVRTIPSLLLPEYLAIYLNTEFGRKQIIRRAMPSNQVNVSAAELKRIDAFLAPIEVQERVAQLVHDSYNAKTLAIKLYSNAQQLLESELGLDKLRFQKPMGYVAKLSEAVIGKRFDADYFQTPFRQIQSHLDNLQTVPLFQLVEMVKGIEVGSKAYTPSGIPFLRVSNIKEKGIELGASDKYISDDLYNLLSAYQPQIGELLLTKDGTAGACFAVDEEVNGIISGGIVRLLPRRDDIPNEYLALVINSRACRMQVEQECSGALILHWKPSSIRKLRIPLLTKHKMQEIADLVSKSKQAKRESERLLEQAKNRVEQLIEEAVQL